MLWNCLCFAEVVIFCNDAVIPQHNESEFRQQAGSGKWPSGMSEMSLTIHVILDISYLMACMLFMGLI